MLVRSTLLGQHPRERSVITKFETHQILSLSTKISSFGIKKLTDLLPPNLSLMETREYFHYISLSISTVKY